MRIQLQAQGHLVAEAANGALAMDILCSEDPPDVVLLDLSMPGLDGYEFLEALNAMNPRPPSKVIIVTADHTPGLPAEFEAMGASGFVYKPLKREDIQRIMDKVLMRSRVGASTILQSAMSPIRAGVAGRHDDQSKH
jgi:two-component system chemotaxis response regulator CheY